MTGPVSPGDAPRPLFPRSHWKFERTGDNRFELVIWLEEMQATAVRLTMSLDEAWALSQGVDRVQAWSAASAEGVFSAGPTPAQAAVQLAICRYVVSARDLDTHLKLAQAAPWASWIELVPDATDRPGAVSWRVDVFAADDSQFLQKALTYGVQVSPVPGDDVLPG